tara:strand:+ start:43 stop:519 length:477 start_codon:yes stop_codon:yes gene_type:complete
MNIDIFSPENFKIGGIVKGLQEISKSNFEKMAARGKTNIARDNTESLNALLDKKSLAQDLDIRYYDDLAEDYESGDLTKSLRDKGFFVLDDKEGYVIAGQTKKDALNLLNAQSPYEYGKSYGYSDDDIAHFYVSRRGGDLDAGYEEYINDLKNINSSE